MIVSQAILDGLRVAFRNDFNTGFAGFAPQWSRVASLIPSNTRENVYGWLKDAPQFREWFGDRVIKSMTEAAYTILNRDFETTVGVNRRDIEDDVLGIYATFMQSLGQSAAEFPDKLVFAQLAAAFTSPCWDGQNFFDPEHPVGDHVVSNMQDGQGPMWVLMDTTRPLKPLIYQERQKPKFVWINQENDIPVFMRRQYIYGADLRAAAGYGMWQMAFGSRAPLTADNYALLRQRMTSQSSDEGHKLNLAPNLIVVGPELRATAKQLFQAERIQSGADNIYYKDVDVVEVPWLAGA